MVKICSRVLHVQVFVEPSGYATQDTIKTAVMGDAGVQGTGAPAHPRKAHPRILTPSVSTIKKTRGNVKEKTTRP
jgi:hypothetical protein